jgi:hypothetical protein
MTTWQKYLIVYLVVVAIFIRWWGRNVPPD